MQNENLPTHVLTEIYDRCGIGFNATDSADSRSKQLSGIEGHEIRTNMYGLMSAIQNAPESEKQAHIDRFISQKFSDDITQDEKEQLTKLFTSEESSSALNSLSVSMKDLNDEEAIMLKLLTSQKVALGSMRDSLIEKVVSSERFAGKLDKLLDRYGSTIYRHYALDKNLSQAKLNAIFAKLPEADKEACLTQMEAIGDKMLADMAEVEKLAQSSKEKFDRIAFVQNYINAMQNLQTSPEVATISQVGSDAKTYLDLQAYRTNNNKIAGINSTLDRMRNLGIEKLTKVVDTITTIPASTTKRMEELKSRYALILQEARASGVYDVIAKQMASELPTVQLTTDKIDEDEIKLISDIVKADSSNPNYAKLKDALKRLDSGKVEEDLSQNLFSKYYKALGIPSKEVQIFSAEIDQQWQKLVNERKEHRKNNTQYTDAYRFLSDADMKKALICKQYIHRQIQIAGNEDVKNQFKQLDKLLNMTINGQLANYHMTMAENNALGLTILDYDAQLEDSLYNLTDSIDGLQTLTSILNTFPANEREALQKAIALKLAAGEGKANFDANKAVREVLSDRYGAFQIQHNMPSANQIIDNCIKTNLTALLKHFPESDRAELESKIQAVLTTNVLDKEEEIRGILFDKYQTSLLSIDSQLDQFVATPDMIVSQWIKESSSSSLSEARASIDRQARQELSCVAGNLGENYSTMLYEDLLRGTKMDAKEDYELTPGQKNQEEHLNKQMISMQETEKAFTLAWAKARTTGDFTALQKLFEKPSAKAPEAEKLAYNSVMTNLKEFGINVEQVEDILKTLKTETYNSGTDT
ncbi:MAG: hypothetical protein IJZ62_01115, partial [Clostridia bacterium]|nr:hypothetical protein [Clostridia bacterium]